MDGRCIHVQRYGPVEEAESRSQRRTFDVCLVFRYKTSSAVKFGESRDETKSRQHTLSEPTKDATQKMKMWAQHRCAVLKSLQTAGLTLFCFYSRDRDEIYCKIGAPPQRLRIAAARMKYKLKLKPEYFGAYAVYCHDFPGRPELHYADRRTMSHFYACHIDDSCPAEDSIFSTRDRIRIIWHIMTSKDADCAGLDIGNLYHQGDIKDYFPLHENDKLQELAFRKMSWVWMHAEHANRVRNYFGDRVALYFLFLAFYWKWLLVPASMGLLLQLIDVIIRTPDNSTAEPFCILMSVWCILLPHFWRRQEAKYAVVWGTLDLEPELEPCRPEHWGIDQLNTVTGKVEPFYDSSKRAWHYTFSILTLLLCGISLTCLILALLFARHQLKGQVAGGIATFQFVLAVIVEIVNALLSLVSRWLTRRENHRTQSEHDMHLLAKVMCLKFVNSYFVLYYIGFFKKHSQLFGVHMNCIRDDCFLDLQAQLAIFFVVRLTVHNFVEFGMPRFYELYRKCAERGKAFVHRTNKTHRLELANMSGAELESRKEIYLVFEDFDETLITHGYATFFAVSSPWVLFATLLWVIIRILLDMQRVTQNRKRPIPVQVRRNEPWNSAYEVYGVVAASTNIALLVFTSESYRDWNAYHKLMLFFYLAHILYLFKVLVKALLPEVPTSAATMKLKQDLIAHRCLLNLKVENQHTQEAWKGLKQLHTTPRSKSKIPVLEKDVTEDSDEEIEPDVNLMQSLRDLKEGFIETISARYLIGLTIAFFLTLLLSACLLIYNRVVDRAFFD